MVQGSIGLFHLVAALVALITGTLVLIKTKGTIFHKRIGYIYSVSMVLMNLSAFGLYNLFGTWGIFHYGAVVSLLTVVGGMAAAIRRKPKWIYRHLAFMYWSVIGLYAAFFSEAFTRIPATPFFGMVGIATGATMFIGAYAFHKNKKKWAENFRVISKT